MKQLKNEKLVGFVCGLIGVLAGMSFVLIFRLPSITFDLLAFTESLFGIGMTVLTLVFALGILNQRTEIETIIARKDEQWDAGIKRGVSELEKVIANAEVDMVKKVAEDTTFNAALNAIRSQMITDNMNWGNRLMSIEYASNYHSNEIKRLEALAEAMQEKMQR